MKMLLFTAEAWCTSCRKMKPFFKDEAERLNVEYEIIDVESDDGVDLSTKYGIRNVPTILFLDGDNILGREGGSMSYTKIKDYLQK